MGGGSVNITTSGNPKQVDVEVNYPQPIYIPGLAELWSVVTGDKGIHHNLANLRDGLGGLPGTVLPGVEAYENLQQQLAQVGVQLPSAPFVMFPYINVRGKCSIGFSDWGGKPEYRPRQHSTVNDAAPDNSTLNKIGDAQKAQTAAKDYQDAVKAETDKCQAWTAARTNLQQAQTHRDQVYQDPNSSQSDKDQADAALSQAQTAEQNAHSAYDAARQDRIQKQQTLEQLTGEDYGDLNCG